MQIIPAIDIRSGNCVMLTQGRIEAETVYSKDPVFIARLWQMKGAKRLHIIDLDGAFQGMPKNLELIKRIRATVNIPIQLGGGVRSLKTIQTLIGLGIDHVIVGTLAVYNPDILKQAVEEFGPRIIVALDVRGTKAAIAGWKETTSVEASELIENAGRIGVKEVIVTDIAKDGMMEGPNIKGLKSIAKGSNMAIIASGGVSRLEDIERLGKLEPLGVKGVIIGKALYTEDIKLEDAIKTAEK